MPNIDIPIKRLMQSRIEDWIEFLIPNCKKEWIKEMDPSKVPPKKESRLDKLILIDSPDERFILNIEPQGYLDYSMSARMLRYRSDIWEYTLAKGIGTPSIKQVVIYFYKNHDNKEYTLEDSWDEVKTLDFNYKAVKVWELKKCLIIERKLEGLYPLLPLMERQDKETDEQVMEITMQTIKTVENSSLQADLLAVMSILVGEKFTSELVKKYIRREMLMNSPIYNEWVQEERKEAAEEAAEKATEKASKQMARKIMKELLVEKFDIIARRLSNKLDKIENIDDLQTLNKKIIKIDTIDNFEKLVDKVLES